MTTIFGDIVPGQLVLINNFGFTCEQPFNFYQEYDTFLKANPACHNESDEDGRIIDYLVSLRCVGTLLADDDNPTQYDFVHPISERTPTYQNILRLKASQTSAMLELNEHQIAVLANGLDTPTSETRTVGYHMVALCDISKTHAVTAENYIHFVRHLNLPYVEKLQQKDIAERGYAINAVFSETGGYNFAYTVGGVTSLGYELIAVCKRFNPRVLGQMVETAIAQLVKDGEVTNLGSLVTGEVVKFEIVDQDINWLIENEVHTHAEKVKQVIFADPNNLLPNQEGYDSEKFAQLLPKGYL